MRRYYRPLLIWPLICFVLANICWMLGQRIDPGFERDLYNLGAFTFIIATIATGIDYATFTWARRIEDFNTARVKGDIQLTQSVVNYHNSILAMNSDQLTYASKQKPRIRIVPGHGTPPLYNLVMPNGNEIGWDFVEEFCRQSEGDYLLERRRFSEGSTQHLWADILTEFFIKNGYAEDAQGNHAAKWFSERTKEDGLYSIGYDIHETHGEGR